MAETALYNRLEYYNSTIENSYRDNWGSLLTYFDNPDTKIMVQLADGAQKAAQRDQEALTERKVAEAPRAAKHLKPTPRTSNATRPKGIGRHNGPPQSRSLSFRHPNQKYADEIS